MLLSIQHGVEQNRFQFFLKNRQADVTDPHLRRQCVPASGTGHLKCPRTNCLRATRCHHQFTRCCRSKVWPGGNAGNRNTAPGQVSRSRSIEASEGHDAEFIINSCSCIEPVKSIVHVGSYLIVLRLLQDEPSRCSHDPVELIQERVWRTPE